MTIGLSDVAMNRVRIEPNAPQSPRQSVRNHYGAMAAAGTTNADSHI